MPEGLRPHSLRRTFASLLYAVGESPRTVMDEMGHSDKGLALKVYAQTMRRDEGQRERLRALLEGADWANMGEPAPIATGAGGRQAGA